MPTRVPFIRRAGSGPGVICLHANASSSSQWRGLMDTLSADHHVLAPDLYGAGKSPDWHSNREISLRDEVDLLKPAFELAGSPYSIVGHSYGGAVALISALLDPSRVRALALYEPTLFAAVDALKAPPNGADGIRRAVAAASAALDAGDADAACAHFIDFWMGQGTWLATPPERKPAIVDSIVNVRRWIYALTTESTPIKALSCLDMPVLYMRGEKSPESALAVAQALIPVLPHVRTVDFPGLGHMAPITHAATINAEIAKFLRELG
jgi:pimeloyl-ACP methyl ester carboxylesterase